MKLKREQDKPLLDNYIFKCVIVSIQKFSELFLTNYDNDDYNDYSIFTEKIEKTYVRGMKKMIPILDKIGKELTSPTESKRVSLLEVNECIHYMLIHVPLPNFIYEYMCHMCFGPNIHYGNPGEYYSKYTSFCKFEDSYEDVCYFLKLLKHGLTTEEDKYDYYVNDTFCKKEYGE